MILAETFVELVKDPAHWMFEIMLMVIFDVLIGAIAWPFIKKAVKSHDEKKHRHEHCGAEPMDLPELSDEMTNSR